MERATKTLKSLIPFRSESSGKTHAELCSILEDFNQIRNTQKGCLKAYNTFITNLTNWAYEDGNEAVKDTFFLFADLNEIWSDAQLEFLDGLIEIQHNFDVILESEQSLDKKKLNLNSCEQTLNKLKKDFSKRWYNESDINIFLTKIEEAQRAADEAKADYTEKQNEYELMKVVRLKDGMRAFVTKSCILSDKCHIIGKAQNVIVQELPESISSRIDDLSYDGCLRAKQAVKEAKREIELYNKSPMARKNIKTGQGAPPPYAPHKCSPVYLATYIAPSSQRESEDPMSLLPPPPPPRARKTSASFATNRSRRDTLFQPDGDMERRSSERRARSSTSWELNRMGGSGWDEASGPSTSNAVRPSAPPAETVCTGFPRTYICSYCSKTFISTHGFIQIQNNLNNVYEINRASGVLRSTSD